MLTWLTRHVTPLGTLHLTTATYEVPIAGLSIAVAGFAIDRSLVVFCIAGAIAVVLVLDLALALCEVHEIARRRELEFRAGLARRAAVERAAWVAADTNLSS